MDDESVTQRLLGWLRPTPSEVVGVVVLLLGCVAATLVWWSQAAGRPQTPTAAAVSPGPVEPEGSRVHPGIEGPALDAEEEQIITVQVTGAVVRAGVVTLPSGSRVQDVVAALGGLAPDAAVEAVNLARELADGEHLHVPSRSELSGGRPPPASTGQAEQRPLDINAASAEQLTDLPGIGPARAEAIAEHRENVGPFTQPGDLRDVPGIGEVTFQRLAELITVG